MKGFNKNILHIYRQNLFFKFIVFSSLRSLVGIFLVINLIFDLNSFSVKAEIQNQCSEYLVGISISDPSLTESYTALKLHYLIESMDLVVGSIPDDKLNLLYFKVLEFKDLEVLKLFLSYFSNILEQRNEFGESDLMYLARTGWLKGFKYLLSLENINFHYYYKYKNVLIVAAENGHDLIVNEILNSSKFSTEVRMYHRIDSALVEAAKNGHIAVVKILLDYLSRYSSSSNIEVFVEQTLVYAAEKQQRDLVEYLLTDFEFDVNARAGHLFQPVLSYAIRSRNREIIDLLLSYKNIRLDMQLDSSTDYIRLAIETDDIETYLKIKESINFDINKIYENKYTLLHLAVLYDAKAIVRNIVNDPNFLLINKKIRGLYSLHGGSDWMDMSPLDLASVLGHEHLVIELLNHPEIDANVSFYNYDSILSYVVEKGDYAIAAILLKSGKINSALNYSRNNYQIKTYFSRIVDSKNEVLIDLAVLLELNAEIVLSQIVDNQNPNQASSPLSRIIAMEQYPIQKRFLWIRKLIEKIKIDPDIKKFTFKDSLLMAAKTNFHEVISLLITEFPQLQIDQKLIIETVQNNSVETLKFFLTKEIDLNFYVNHNNVNTLMGLAIAKNYFEIGMLLLQDPRLNLNIGFLNNTYVVIGKTDGFGWLSGVFNSNSPNLDLVKIILLTNKIDIQLASSFNKNTLLIWAIENNNNEFFNYILNSRFHTINHIPQDKLSALMLAIKNKNTYFVSELLAHPDIDVRLNDYQGKSAVDYAIKSDSLEIFNMLLEHPQLSIYSLESFRNFSYTMNKLIHRKKLDFIKLILESSDYRDNAILYFANNPNDRDILTDIKLRSDQLILLDPLAALKMHFEDFNLIQDTEVIKNALIELGLPESKVRILYDRIKRRDVGLWFLQYIMVNEFTYKARDSIDLLQKITIANFDPDKLRHLSDDTLSTLVEFIIEIHKYVRRDAKFWNKIHPDLYNKKNIKNLITFFSIFNSYYQTIHNDKLSYVDVFLDLIKDIELLPENIEVLTELIKSALIKSVNKLLNTDNFKFDITAYQKLLTEWGDLEPIWVLISRLNISYPKEVEVIRNIFMHSLKGAFKEYKFRTNDQQLQMLSSEQLETWKAPDAIISIAGKSASFAEQILQTQEMLQNITNTNLKPHWLDFLQSLSLQEEDKKFDSEEILSLIANINKSQDSPNELIKKLANANVELELIIISELINSFHIYSNDLELTKKIMTVIKLNLLNFDGSSKELASQVINDLSDIIKKITTVFTEVEGRSIIATVKNSDPKLLLTVGDVVCTSSCQNYKTGTVIRTLPGYVIDGNVQAIVSFQLKSSNFQNGDFYKLIGWVENKDEPYQVEFDGNLRQFKFIKNNIVILSKLLDYAYLRNMLKIGVIDQSTRPAIFMERAYEQSNPYIMQMREQHTTLFRVLAERLGAATSGKIKIFKSRNPEGQYSDASGGINLQDYFIHTH